MKWVLGIACLWLLSACSAPQPPLRVGLLEWPPYELTWMAERLGYFEGNNIELVEFQSPAEASRAYMVGSLDIVAVTLDYAIDFYAKDREHRAFLVIDESFGGDVAISRKPLPDLKQLAGQRIGLEGGALGAHMLHRLLEKAGLKAKDVRLEYFDIPDQQAAYESGKTDIVITYDPVRTQLLKAGGHEIFSSREIPGEIVDVFVARVGNIDKRRADFQSFTRAWFKALQQLREKPEESARLMAPRLNMSAEEFLNSLKGVRLPSLAENHQMLGDNNKVFIDGASRFVASLRTMGVADVPGEIKSLFTAVALPDASGDN